MIFINENTGVNNFLPSNYLWVKVPKWMRHYHTEEELVARRSDMACLILLS